MEEISAFGRSFTMPELTTSQKVPDGLCNEHRALTCAAAIAGASIVKASESCTASAAELITNAATPESNRCLNCVATLALKELS